MRHSTHVAGTTCGANYGVATCNILCAIRVLGNDGSGSFSGIIAGVNHVVKDCEEAHPGQPVGARRCVANMSLGGGQSDSLNQAVADAADAGIVMVVAAGNDNYDACQYSPASEAKAITVGSTTIEDRYSGFSNYGACVDVYAPGSDIVSARSNSGDGTATLSGTSMASPRELKHQRLQRVGRNIPANSPLSLPPAALKSGVWGDPFPVHPVPSF